VDNSGPRIRTLREIEAYLFSVRPSNSTSQYPIREFRF
jgi:hypothetical protein